MRFEDLRRHRQRPLVSELVAVADQCPSRTLARACSNRDSSASCPTAARCDGTARTRSSRRAGPTAVPAEAPTPRSTAPGSGVGKPSPKPWEANSRSAAVTSCACRPELDTTTVSPRRAPSATTLVRLRALTGCSAGARLGDQYLGVVRGRPISTDIWRRAGHAGSTCSFPTGSSHLDARSSPEPCHYRQRTAATPAPKSRCRPRSALPSSPARGPPRRRPARVGRPWPRRLRRPPSPRPAERRSGAPARSASASSSTASSALISALPRSISTSTPSRGHRPLGDRLAHEVRRSRAQNVRLADPSRPPRASVREGTSHVPAPPRPGRACRCGRRRAIPTTCVPAPRSRRARRPGTGSRSDAQTAGPCRG